MSDVLVYSEKLVNCINSYGSLREKIKRLFDLIDSNDSQVMDLGAEIVKQLSSLLGEGSEDFCLNIVTGIITDESIRFRFKSHLSLGFLTYIQNDDNKNKV